MHLETDLHGKCCICFTMFNRFSSLSTKFKRNSYKSVLTNNCLSSVNKICSFENVGMGCRMEGGGLVYVNVCCGRVSQFTLRG